ncbi:MAG: hypothetical protein ACREI8_06115, partial [Myxococcota bacterium]
MIHVVLEAAHGDLPRALDPGWLEGLGAGREHERHERLCLGAGDTPLAPRLSERPCHRARALEPKQGAGLARRQAEPLARVGVEAAEAEVDMAAGVGEREEKG